MMAEETQYRENFRAALRRLTREIDNLRTEIAAYQEAQPPKNRFLVVAFIGMLGDRLLRLIRILEDGGDAASFWYLYRCAPHRMKTLDEAWLRNFSGKLKAVPNITFVHLDKKGIALDENRNRRGGCCMEACRHYGERHRSRDRDCQMRALRSVA